MRRSQKRGLARVRRAKVGTTVWGGPDWHWVTGNEYYNDTTRQWAKETRPGVLKIVRNER